MFEKFSQEELGRVCPICIHGDKGRGYLKLPIFNFSFESVHGIPKDLRDRGARPGERLPRREHGGKLQWTCGKRSRELHNQDLNFDDSDCTKRRKLNPGEAMDHNGRGHVFMTRFLGTAVPSKMLKANENLIPAYLQEISSDVSSLFNDGVSCEARLLWGSRATTSFMSKSVGHPDPTRMWGQLMTVSFAWTAWREALTSLAWTFKMCLHGPHPFIKATPGKLLLH